MKRCVLGLVICASIAGLCTAADKEKSNSLQVQDLAWLVGEWEGEYTMPKGFPDLGPAGARVVSTNTWQWALGKKFIALKIRDEIDGKTVSTGDEILGANHETGRLGHWFFASKGFHGHGDWSRSGDTFSITWQSFEPDGKRYEGVSDHVRVDADTHTWQIRDLKENGKKIADWPKVTFRRRVAAAPGEDGLWQAYRTAAAGTWDGSGTLIRDFPELGISEGEKFKMRFSLVTGLDGNALEGETEFEMLDKPFTAQCRVLAGWDPQTRQVNFLALWSGGLVEEIRISRQRGTAFLGTYTTKSPGSETLKARIRMDYDTPDTYVIKFLDGPHKGRELSRWSRVK